MQTETIHTAYAVSRRGGTTYRATAYVLRSNEQGKFRHTFGIISLDDTALEAQENAVKYILEQYISEGLEAPIAIVHHGKKSAIFVDSYHF
jgi:hypothetical protein